MACGSVWLRSPPASPRRFADHDIQEEDTMLRSSLRAARRTNPAPRSAATVLGLALLPLTLAASLTLPVAVRAEPAKPECIAPAKPGGGFDLTCRIAQTALSESKQLNAPLRITYMPGGIGAVAYNAIIGQRPAEAGTIVAWSGGSLLNIAQGKFGRFGENDVRWLAAIGADYGVVVVRADAPWKSMKELMEAIRKEPAKVVFGAGGTIGSQDWMKAALTARAAGIDHKTMRFVAFEGGGEAMTALQGGHIQVYSGDAGEMAEFVKQGAPIRLLGVFADERLPGALKDVPTAKEQGYDIQWPIARGFYVGPKVSDADYQWWVSAFKTAMATPEYQKLRTERGLFPFDRVGDDLDRYVKAQVASYRKLATEFGLNVTPQK
jgi:putative tricarboxylic transport membrane protein